MRHLFAICVIISVGWITQATAVPTAIVITELKDTSNPQAYAPVSQIKTALAEQGFVVGDAAQARVAPLLGQTVAPLSDAEVGRIADAAAHVKELYSRLTYKSAAAEGERFMKAAQNSPHYAYNESIRKLLKSVILTTVAAQIGAQDMPSARKSMAKYLDLAHKEPISRDWIPAVRDLHKQLAGKARASILNISTGTPGETIWLNGRSVGRGATSVAIGKGVHWVGVGNPVKRFWKVQVKDKAAKLIIPWRLAMMTRLEPGVWTSQSELPKTDAVKLAAALGSDLAIVTEYGAGDAKAIVVTPQGKVARQGRLSDFASSKQQSIQRFARFLASGDEMNVSGGRPFRRWKWATGITGVAALGTGVTLMLIDKEGEPIPGTSRTMGAVDTMVPGIITAGVGGVLTGISIYMFVRDSDDRKRSEFVFTPSVSTDYMGFGLSGTF